MDEEVAGAKLLDQEVAFVFRFFEMAEREARATERYVLIGIGAIFSYLATQESVIEELPLLVWYAPAFVVLMAWFRAVSLGFRQKQLMSYLKTLEAKLTLPTRDSGWATYFTNQGPFVAVWAATFYLVLLLVTVVIAVIMTGSAT